MFSYEPDPVVGFTLLEKAIHPIVICIFLRIVSMKKEVDTKRTRISPSYNFMLLGYSLTKSDLLLNVEVKSKIKINVNPHLHVYCVMHTKFSGDHLLCEMLTTT